ncbi:energy transducer TonB [Niastella vici]|uniref:Energy transducer TonB n=1 Tax=Niastella vici TaxID=1703345 RepID=A0A1V9FRU7_9BACT|nr:energy transducer TonB [Niastella vici]OQP61060.1 energy transducer TonB [Niastella vici]
MESSTILTADVLDIIFEGRNKDYGAYDLRRSYNRRLKVSITVMLSVICMLSLGFVFAGKRKKVDPALLAMKDIELAAVKPEQPVEPPLPPPPPKPPAPPVQVQMRQFTTIKIVQEVKPEEMPPETKELEDVTIGKMNKDGVKDDGIVAPPIDVAGTGVIEGPKKEEEDKDHIFVSVQIESEFPGGPAAWQRFLHKNLNYPQEAQDNGIQGYVTVQFIVDEFGNVSNVVVLSGPEELRAEAIRVIKKSGKWTPAVQNGRNVKSYKKQPLGFKLNDE